MTANTVALFLAIALSGMPPGMQHLSSRIGDMTWTARRAPAKSLRPFGTTSTLG